ncbi:MAG: hypothetical protein ACOX5Q_03480 [Bacillota bacterium]|jgi:hypothetical protein|nr:hypothetical protein [Candidatus Fermentithermobacillaceae bacterium]
MMRRKFAMCLMAVFVAISVLSGCKANSGGRGSAKSGVEVPEEIVQHFLSHPHFSTFKTEPSDLEWLVYSEEEDRWVVGATFKAKDGSGNDKDWYYLTAFEPGTKEEAPRQLYGALASIDDPDFDGSGFSVREVDTPSGDKTLLLTATGIAGDPEVQKVVLETSEGRNLQATMYGRFWLVALEAVSQNEKVIKTVGYSADGTQLYQDPPFVLEQGLSPSPVRGPNDIPEYVLRHFYDRQEFATDVEWKLCVEKDGEVTAGATYTGVSKTGPIDCYFLAVYSTQGKLLRGNFDSIDDSGFSVGGGFFATEDPDFVSTGYASDHAVKKVICETNKGRSIEATMYGPFWIAVIKGGKGVEAFSEFVAYDAEGVELHRVKR